VTPSLRVVLDPNVLVSGAITPRGAGARILALIDSGDLVSIASPQLVAELSAVLRRPKFRRYLDLEDVGEFMDEFVTLSEPHDDPSDPAPLSPDSKDDYLIALALDSRADALVSGDSDLHGLDVLGLRVFTPRELLDRYLLDQDV